ncbi:ABC transporter substrate-binding protein [Saccharibacillus sacchari]|uniref:ABC transporter substrate-binding protein n=1 Tax=Saccharibacillus sacchari TaxID=456493 RepID=A0ACC6PK38_9BACL
MKAMRVMTVKSLLSLSLVFMLGACGSAGVETTASDTKSEDNLAAQSTVAQEETSATRTYTDYNGTKSEIPAVPKRIVSVAGSGATIDLLELGFSPIAYPYRYMQDSSILKDTVQQLNATATDIGMPTNLEAVLGRDPDLIVFGYETQDGEQAQLEKIAPVAAFDESLAFQDRLLAIGDIVDKQDEAKAIVADINEQTEQMWKQLYAEGKIGKDETAAVVVYYWNKKMYVMKNFGVFDLINHPSGMKLSPEIEALNASSSSSYIELSEEAMVDTLVSDHLFLIYDQNEEATEGFKQLRQSSLFQMLPQVKNEKVHYIPIEYNDSDLITVRKLIQDFPSLLDANPSKD